MDINKISKQYAFNIYLSLFPQIALTIGLTIWILSKKEGMEFFHTYLIGILTAFPFICLIANVIYVKKKKGLDFWLLLFLIVNLMLCIHYIFGIPKVYFPYWPYNPVMSNWDRVTYLLSLNLMVWSEDVWALGKIVSIIYIVFILRSLWKNILIKKGYILFGKIIYLILLVINISIIIYVSNKYFDYAR